MRKLSHMQVQDTIPGGLELVLMFDGICGEALSLQPGAPARDVAAALRQLAARVERLAVISPQFPQRVRDDNFPLCRWWSER